MLGTQQVKDPTMVIEDACPKNSVVVGLVF